jgi:hypothetical protein
MKQQIHLFAFGIAFLGIVHAANATCPDGAEKPCTINGKHGHQVCGHGGWGPCVPDEESSSPTPAPTPGSLTGTWSADDGVQAVFGKVE